MLETLVKANGLSLVSENGLIRVTAPPDASQAAGLPARDARGTNGDLQLVVYKLRYLRAEQAARTLRELFGQGSNGPNPLLNRTSAPEPRRERVPNPLLAPSERADSVVQRRSMPAEVRGPIQVVADAATNALVLRGTATDIEVLRAAIEQLDARPMQVLIEVLIAEVQGDKQMDLGLNITVPEQYEHWSRGRASGEMKSTTAGDIAMRVLGVGGIRADVVLRALAASSKVHVLSRPVLFTHNNQEARILVGSQRPFVQVSRALPTDAAVRDQVVQYRDVGTELTITPTISPDGYVTLEVLQEVSNATTETQFGAPVISTREVETQLFIKDGHTAVIGGLVDRQTETGNSGIPLLRSIPLLGIPFRSSHRRTTTTELFILLTPHVIRSDSDLEVMTNQIRNDSQQGGSSLKSLVPSDTVPAKLRQ